VGFIRFVIGTAATVVFKSGIFCWSAGICRRRNVCLWGSYYITELVVNDNISVTGYSEEQALILRKLVPVSISQRCAGCTVP